ILSEILIEEGADVAPGSVLGRIAESTRANEPQRAATPPGRADLHIARSAEVSAQLPPGIRRLLSEHGLKAEDVPHKGERLTREDIEAEVARQTKTSSAPGAGAKVVPHDFMRRRIAEHMAHSMQTAPHVTALFEADFSAIIAHREAHKADFARESANLTFTAYMVAASVEAMKAVPQVNARWFEDRIEIPEDINIGVGTALGDKGLIVPVIHRARTLSLLEIAQRLTE